MNASKTQSTDDLKMIERTLESILVPVAPRADFVRRLDHQLRSAPLAGLGLSKADIRANPGKYTLIGMAGIFSILMLVAAGFRTAAALMSAIGLISEFNKRVQAEKRPPGTPAA